MVSPPGHYPSSLHATDGNSRHLALFVLIKGGFQLRREKEEACSPVLYEPFCPHCPPQLGPWERRAVGDGSEPFTVPLPAAPRRLAFCRSSHSLGKGHSDDSNTHLPHV